MKFKGIVTHVVEKSGLNKKGEPYVAYQYRIEENTPSYPQSMIGDVFGDKVEVLREGQLVEVDFNLRTDEYQGRWYGKNAIWKVNVIEQPHESSPAENFAVAPEQIPANESFDNKSADDLPF